MTSFAAATFVAQQQREPGRPVTPASMSDGGSPVELDDVLRLLRAASITLFSQDANLRYRWAENPPSTWSLAGGIQGKTDADLLPPGTAALVAATKKDVLTTGQPRWTDFTVERHWAQQHFELYVEGERDDAGAITGVTGLLLDVTERRKRLAALESIVRQSAHRSKNLLAVLQSLAVQTARTSASTEQFIEQYRGRIQSISSSQDLAFRTGSQEVSLSSLIEAQVAPYAADAARQVQFEGDDCALTANAALHVGLALSELATTSANGGALSQDSGHVSIRAERAEVSSADAVDRCLRLTWAERGTGSVALPQGFAQQLLERLIPSALSGRGALSSLGEEPRYELIIAPSEFRDLP